MNSYGIIISISFGRSQKESMRKWRHLTKQLLTSQIFHLMRRNITVKQQVNADVHSWRTATRPACAVYQYIAENDKKKTKL